jgi:hypothetical protein
VRLEWDGFDEVADGEVVARSRRTLRGRSGGLEAVLELAVVFSVAGGAVTRMRWFQTREEAVEAARGGAAS